MLEKRAIDYIEKTFVGASPEYKDMVFKNWMNKERCAEGLFNDFKQRAGEVKDKIILELGFGSGLQIVPFSKNGGVMYGLEVDSLLLSIARQTLEEKGIKADLNLYNGSTFPFPDDFFDFIYATSVLEHITDLDKVMEEAYRTLKKGGRFYLSFPNRIWPKETHTGIWFLSYFPRPVALYIARNFFKISNADDWNLHFLSYWSLKRLLKKNNIKFNIIFETESDKFLKRIIKKIMAFFGVHHSAVLRTVMLVLEK